MNKGDLIPGTVYMHRNTLPCLLLTNRLFSQKHTAGGPVYSLAPQHVRAARKSSGEGREAYGYLVIMPGRLMSSEEAAKKMAELPFHEYLDRASGLPLPGKVPQEWELGFVYTPTHLLGEYATVRAQRESESRLLAEVRKRQREEYNALAEEANELLGDAPLTLLTRDWEEAPVTIPLTPQQLRRLVRADPTAK